MRFETEFDYVLKIREAQGLPENPQEGEIYSFEKTIERIYPLNLPILLMDDDYKVIGKCVILEYTAGNGVTKGKYKIESVFSEEKSKVFTDDILETVAISEKYKKDKK